MSDVYITEPDQVLVPKVNASDPEEWAPKTIMEVFEDSCAVRGNKPALWRKTNGEAYSPITWSEYRTDVLRAARASLKLGLPKHHGVAILGFNCYEWFVAKFGAIFAGGIDAGVYPTNGPDAIAHLVNNCEAHIAFAESPSALAKFYSIRDRVPSMKVLVLWGDEEVPESLPSTEELKIIHWTEFLKLGDDTELEPLLQDRISSQVPGSVCSLIYTSGTTGAAKGVMLTHDCVMWCAISAGRWIDIDENCRAVSFLPLAHVAAQIIDQYAALRFGFQIYFAQPDALKGSLGDTLREVRPTHFISIPRVWEKMMEKMKEIGAKTTGAKKSIATWAKSIGLESNRNLQEGKSRPWGYTLANTLVFKKAKHALGLDQCRWFCSAAAPISMETLEYFLSLDIPICQVLGLSETSGPATIAIPRLLITGNVGNVFPGTECRIVNPDATGEGEICFRGRHRFAGYLHNPEETVKSIDTEGWLHTGDLGKMDDLAFLSVTGRLKELIITAGGENVAPILIEDHIKAGCPLLSNVIAIGDRQKYLTCLLSLKTEVNLETMIPSDTLAHNIKTHLKNIGSSATTIEEAKTCPKVVENIEAAITRANELATSRAQKVQKFRVLPVDLSIPGGDLTPTMKIKRKIVHQKYAELINEMYE
eukprot:TRINITY_DN16785_c0_g1_i1.p1 TRINITY_DN16785_c0_g1~~TRINITY_DN16785_c0_g1_i1.p1  ORF type:complete len:660 (+),score=194.25 TRINITY_DN16785_c0_g1_i1:39-1982(+)